MQKLNNSQSRSAFIKKASLAVATFFGLGAVALNVSKPNKSFDLPGTKLTDEEANDIIKDMPYTDSKSLKPEPPPVKSQTVGE